MAVDIKTVSELRARTGAGLMDAKKALEAAGGDIEKAIDTLRKAGAAKPPSALSARQRKVLLKPIFTQWKIGSMIALTCETDFVARNEKFRQMAKDIAMHVAAANRNICV